MTILDSIGISLVPLIGQIVGFLVLYFVFKKFLFGPIMENLDKRAKKQNQAMKAAEETIKIKEELAAAEKQARQKIQRQIQEELQKASKEAETRRQELISQAKKEAQAAASREYEAFSKRIQDKEKEVRQNISTLVIEAAKKALAEHLDERTSQTIVAQQINKLKKLKV